MAILPGYDEPHFRGAAPTLQAQANVQGLYLHVPFCFHKCHYCDFFSVAGEHGPQRLRQFELALHAELEEKAARFPLRVSTVFVGGGTPTLLPAEAWPRLLDAIRPLTEGPLECTVEANPETLTSENAAALAEAGVSRLSMGAQTFDPALLRRLERHHAPESVEHAVATAREAGIPEVSLDLIFAVPGQTLRGVEADLRRALALAPDHISCYSLTFEPGTALTARRDRGELTPMDPETERRMQERVMTRMEEAGFEQYEISNWARRSAGDDPCPRRCRHNLLYWQNGNWLGIGPSAASHVDGIRWRNQPRLGAYLAKSPHPPIADEEHLDRADRRSEAIMLGLRTSDGLSRAWLREQLPPDDARWGRIAAFAAQGLLADDPDAVRLTREGVFHADGIAAELM